MKKNLFVSMIVFLMILSCINIASSNVATIQMDSNDSKDDFSEKTIYGEFVPGEVIVGFKNIVDVSKNKATISSLIESKNGVLKEPDEKLNIATVKVDVGTEKDFIEQIKQDPSVEYAEPNYLAYSSVVPNDPQYSQQWGLENIYCPAGWDSSTGLSGVKIAIVDTGVDYAHPDLADDIVSGYDFVDISFGDYDSSQYRFRDSILDPYYDDYKTPDNDPMDVEGHGTHCAGIAGAVTDNGIGISGVSWDCSIMPVRSGFKCEVYLNGVWYEVGLFEYDDVKNAIEYAADNGADVISMSFGGPDSYMMENACNYAYNKGCILVSSSGNEGKAVVSYPARYETVIAVGAIDQNNNKCSFSNSGPNLELVAPGKDILSTLPGTNYGYKDGTSMAGPHVAGVAALAISRYPSYSNSQIRQILRDSADDLGLSGRDNQYGYGLVNATLVVDGTLPPEEPRVIVSVDYVEKIDEIDSVVDGWFVWETEGRLPEWYYEISIVNLDDLDEKQTQTNYNRYGEWPWQWNHENHWDVDVDHEFGVYDWYKVGVEITLKDRDLYDLDDTADVSGDDDEVVFAAIYDLSDDSVEVWIDKYIDDWAGPDSNGYIVINGELDDNSGDDDDAKIRLKISDNYDPPQASATIQNSPTKIAYGKEIQFYGSVAGGAEPFSWEWRFRGPSDSTLHSTEQNPTFAYKESDNGKTYNPSVKVTDGLGYSDKGYNGLINIIAPSIEITKPEKGYRYSSFTGENGRSMFFFPNLVMYINYNVEVSVHAVGATKVKFILEKHGSVQDTNFVTSDDDLYEYDFGKIGFGLYTITVEAYQDNDEVCSDSVSKIFSIPL